MAPSLPPEKKPSPDGLCWRVARVRHGREVGVRDRLSELGVEHFVPMKIRKATRGHSVVEEPLLNCLIFLRATRERALSLIHDYGVQADYLFDCATHRMMVVPDKEMDDFRRVFDLSTDEGGLLGERLAVGERVKVLRGPLRDVEGEVVEIQGNTYVEVCLIGRLWARAKVPRAWLGKI